MPTPSTSPSHGPVEAVTVLTSGTLEVTGRLTDASNVTLLAQVTLDGLTMPCIYKPIRGERPLWDFPGGPLAHRELAAYLVSEASGWGCVPPTVLRSGPYGEGMVQRWIGEPPDVDGRSSDGDEPGSDDVPGVGESGRELVALLPAGQVPAGWLPVFRALDEDGTPLAVCHADDPALAVIAGFDVVVNNADRKAPHLLPVGPRVYGVDHGLTFHTDDKLRTILWGWAGEPLPAPVTDGLERLRLWLPEADALDDLLSRGEQRRLRQRIDELAAAGRYPEPPDDRTPIPWPPL
ncbi:SCO1664 family protein [Nakamurella lactea]|uniref:SCO1664 family protein n=1 Tax=Nakamurella lactea TaxID=459515 RepID=UPI0003F732B8|nr:SCO1664 family protein [Nakamurella lactea]